MIKNRSKNLLKLLLGFIIIIVGLGLYFNSVLKNWDIEQDLGGNYILCADGEIFYRWDDEEPVEDVIPFGTVRYGYNECWIVVETKTRSGFHRIISPDTTTGEVCDYWIIDKSISVDADNPSVFENIYNQNHVYSIVGKGLIGPLDSLSFEIERQKRGIEVRLDVFKK